jgi:phosphoribosyl-AMP cyclohydrolase
MQTIDLSQLETEVSYNRDGLVPVIAQDAITKTVLMMAWMNKEALDITLKTGDVTYYSRSRQKLWRKGETSGHTQKLVNAYLDCDGDTLLVTVEQIGAACHTGAPHCFFRQVKVSC